MDPLSSVIAVLRPHTSLSKPITGRGDWGVRYAAYGQPGFAIVVEGHCWLAIDRDDPVRLDEGDFLLLPATPAFEMSSRPGIACTAATPSQEPVRHGDADGAPDFRMLGGSFRFEQANASLAVALLPRMIHLRASEGETAGVFRIIDLIVEESFGDRPGGALILQRLLEVLLIEALRQSGREKETSPGLVNGLRDPAIARALCAIHDDVGKPWSVAGLAGVAGMSRSAFAARFTQLVGCGPIEYRSRWRMELAKDRLSRGGATLDRVAEAIGYESASAFSTAFSRRVGCPPGFFSRVHR
jgi:AraC-like DNA-binding protein